VGTSLYCRWTLTQEKPKGEQISGACAWMKVDVKIGNNVRHYWLAKMWWLTPATQWEFSRSTTENGNMSYKEIRESELLSR